MISRKISKSRIISLTATFAALYGTLRLAPVSMWIGAPGRAFTASEFIAPLFGIVLGPYAGSVAAVVGTLLGISLTARVNFFGLDFLPAMLSALVLGFLMRGRWLISCLLYSVLLVLFFIDPSTLHFISLPVPNGNIAFPFVWLHIIAWVLLVSPLSKRSVEWISARNMSKATIAVLVLTLIGTTVQHLAGTLIFATMAVPLMGISPKALEASWIPVFYVYPVERLIIILGSTAVTLGAVRAFKALGLLQATEKIAYS
jgi:hypothetical protein